MALTDKYQSYVDDGGSRPTQVSLVYDPKTGQWVPSTSLSTSTITSSGKPPLKDKAVDPTKPTTKKTGDSSPNVDSQKEADKEYIEVEFNILTGEMKVTPTTKSIRIKVNDTVKIEGLGKYLSGLYFVSSISRNLSSSNGYSHTFMLLKNGFGSNLKSASTDTEPRKEEVVKEAPEYKVGDSVKIVGEDAIYSNAHDGVKVPKWVKQKTLTIQQISDDKTRVLVMPILSWTYVKYIQKV